MRGGRQTQTNVCLAGPAAGSCNPPSKPSNALESTPPPPQALSVHLFLTSGLKPSFPVYTPPSSSAMPSELHRNRQKVRSGLQATVCQPQAETIYLQYNQ